MPSDLLPLDAQETVAGEIDLQTLPCVLQRDRHALVAVLEMLHRLRAAGGEALVDEVGGRNGRVEGPLELLDGDVAERIDDFLVVERERVVGVATAVRKCDVRVASVLLTVEENDCLRSEGVVVVAVHIKQGLRHVVDEKRRIVNSPNG